MINRVKTSIPDFSEFRESFHGGSFPFKAGERSEGSVKVGLGTVEAFPGFFSSVLGGGTSFLIVEGSNDLLNNEVLCDDGPDGLTLGAVSGGGAPVERVAASVLGLGTDVHSGPAVSAPENTEPGKQPVGFSGTATHSFDTLNSSPKVTVNDGFMGVKVDEFPEVNFSKHNFGLEQARHAVEAPANVVVSEEPANRFDGDTVPAHFESLDSDRGLVVRDENPVGAFGVAGNVHVPRNNTTGHGVGLRGPELLTGLPAVKLVERPYKGALKPARSGLVGHFTEVHCDDTATCGFYSVNDFVLDRDGSNKSVKVGDGYNVGFPVFDGFNSGQHSWPVVEEQSSGCVEFFPEVEQVQVFGLAPIFDSSSLVAGRNEVVAFSAGDFGNTDYSDDPHYCFKIPEYLRRVVLDIAPGLALGQAYGESSEGSVR